MADEKITIEGEARVAFDLMKAIAVKEQESTERKSDPRKYYLKLYAQSIAVVRGASAASILDD